MSSSQYVLRTNVAFERPFVHSNRVTFHRQSSVDLLLLSWQSIPFSGRAEKSIPFYGRARVHSYHRDDALFPTQGLLSLLKLVFHGSDVSFLYFTPNNTITRLYG